MKYLLGLLLLPLGMFAQDRTYGKLWATRSQVMAQNGMVATSHPLSTQAALDVLKAGGNAIDAAIAANAMEGVVEPHVNGIGGDLFAIVWDAKTKKLYGLNGSGRSPKSLTLAEFKKRGLTHIPSLGPLPVSVPGAVDAWFELHKKFGSMPMPKVLNSAVSYARTCSRQPADQQKHNYFELTPVQGLHRCSIRRNIDTSCQRQSNRC